VADRHGEIVEMHAMYEHERVDHQLRSRLRMATLAAAHDGAVGELVTENERCYVSEVVQYSNLRFAVGDRSVMVPLSFDL